MIHRLFSRYGFLLFVLLLCFLFFGFKTVQRTSLYGGQAGGLFYWAMPTKQADLPWFFEKGLLRPPRNLSQKVWPEQLRTDRIVEQLMQTAADSENVKTIHINSEYYFAEPLGRDWFLTSKCPVSTCELVNKDVEHADAVVFLNSVSRSRAHVPPSQIWVLYVLESPYHGGVVNVEGSVNWTATYRYDSDISAPYYKWLYYNDYVKQNDDMTNIAEGKTKKVAMFVSNCKAKNNRMDYARELQKYIDVDIYGACGDLKCERKDLGCFEMLRTDYKFYLAFENSNCREYITEKFFHNALSHDVLPIVMGAHPDDYAAVAPKDSYIHVDQFPSARDLAEYLAILDANDDLYNSFFRWKGTGEFINTLFFCRLCALLHTPRDPHYYPNFHDWWQKDKCRSGSWVV